LAGREGENITSRSAPNISRNPIAFLALAITSARRAASCAGAVEGDRDHVQIPLGDFLFQFRCRDLVSVEDLGELRHPDPDEPCIPHHIEDVSEWNSWKRIPEVSASANERSG